MVSMATDVAIKIFIIRLYFLAEVIDTHLIYLTLLQHKSASSIKGFTEVAVGGLHGHARRHILSNLII